MLMEIIKLNPEVVTYVYGLSYIFVGTTSFFLLTRKTISNKSLYLWLGLWGLFYGVHEMIDLVTTIKHNFYLEMVSQYLKFFAYYFLSNILIFGLGEKRGVKQATNKKNIISIFVLVFLITVQYFASKILFLIPSVVALFIGYEFFKINRDSAINARVRKISFVISVLFFLFSVLTILYSLKLYGADSHWPYFFKISRSAIGLLISLNLLYYFLEDLTPSTKPKYYNISKRFISVAFILFIFGVFISNKIITDAKTDHLEHMENYRIEDLNHIVGLYNNSSEKIFFLNRAIAESAQVTNFMREYYDSRIIGSEEANQVSDFKDPVYDLFDSINTEDNLRIFYIMDLDGKTIISSNRNDQDGFEGKNYSFRPYFQEAILGENTIYYAKGVTSDKKGGYYASPIYSEDDEKEIIGVIVLKIDEKDLFEFLVSEDGSFLLDSRGYVFASKKEEIIDKKLFSDTKDNEAIINKNNEESSFKPYEIIDNNVIRDFENNTYFYRTVDIKPEGWEIGFFEPHDHIDKIVLEKIFTVLFFITIYMAVFYFIITYFIDTLILQITENKYKDIYNNSSDLIFSFNSSQDIIFVNPAWKRDMDYEDRDLSKLKIKDLIYREDRKHFKKITNKVFSGREKRVKTEIRFINKNGKIVWGVGTIEKEIRDDEFYMLRGIFRNNTEEKNKQKLINDKNKELADLLQKAEQDKSSLEKQRLATLNILDDISETRSRLMDNNKSLQKRSEEMKNLASLSSEISNLTDVEKIITKIKNFLFDNVPLCSLSIRANFLQDEDSFCKIYLKEKLNQQFLDSVKKENKEYCQKNKTNTSRCGEVQVVGKTNNNNHIKKIKSSVYLDLKSGDNFLGFIGIFSSEPNVYDDDLVNFLKSVASLFSSAISNSQFLLKAEHSKTESLVRALNDGIILLENPNKILLLNSSAEKYTGITKDNEKIEDFYRETSNYSLREKIEMTFGTGKIIEIGDLEYTRNNKKYIYEILIIPVSDFEGKGVGVAMVIRDITQEKYIDRMKTEFVSVASHQLRTPLTAIKLFTEMLVKEQVGKISPEQKEYLSNVYDSTERMVSLVNDLLNVTRIESGRLMVNPEDTDIRPFLSSLISEAKSLAETKKIDIKLKYKTKLKSISIDRSLLRQVYHNLLTNAIRYSKENSRVVVEVSSHENNLLITVTDSGIGIPKEVQSRMFEKFFRADNAVKVATEGTGLGLYVSKMIVESSGGKIWFESSKKGTKFYVSIPKTGMKKKKGERGLSIS